MQVYARAVLMPELFDNKSRIIYNTRMLVVAIS